MTRSELEGKLVALLVVGEDAEGEADARVFVGRCRCPDGAVELDRGAAHPPVKLFEEWLGRMQLVPESVRNILQGADYVIRLSIGSLPDDDLSGFVQMGLRWPPSAGIETATIHVYLLDEGIDVWRPVQAHHLGGDRYQITSVNAAPDDEHWQFSTGDIVRCSKRALSGGPALVAIEQSA